MSIKSKFAKVKAQGFFRTMEVWFNRFVPPWIFRYSMGHVFDLDLEKLKLLGNRPAGRDGVTIKCLDENADPEERLRLRQFTWNSVPLETTHNDLGFLAYDPNDPNKILGGVWGGLESFSENNLGVDFQFKKHQAWLYCAFVDDAARGRGVYQNLISSVAEELECRGYSQLLAIVQPWNKVSLRIHAKLSRGICGWLSATRIFNLVWVRSAGNLDVDKQLVTNIASNPARVKISGVEKQAGNGVNSERVAKPLKDALGGRRMPKPN